MWLQETSPIERRALRAAFAGYGLDGFDFMAYSFIIPSLLTLWNMSKAQAGYIASAALITSALGGWAAGILADRYGRTRILQLTVLWFAAFTCLSGFAQSFGQLLAARALQGFGFGGEWSVGSVLVAEYIAARHRGKASGLVQSSWSVGWGLAALAFWAASALLAPQLAWRAVLWLGILPALLIIYIRRNVAEPPLYLDMRARHAAAASLGAAAHENFLEIFHPTLLRTTVLATLLSAGMMGGYYSITTWLPTFLSSERHLSVAGTTAYMLMVIVGSFLGYLFSAWLADAIGRRFGFILFAVCAAGLIVLYANLPLAGGTMFLLGLPLGFFVLGIFSSMGACLAELYPSAVRGSGQGFCYGIGRALGGFCPTLIGVLSTRVPLGKSMTGLTLIAYALVVVAAWALPETRGRILGDATAAPRSRSSRLLRANAGQ